MQSLLKSLNILERQKQFLLYQKTLKKVKDVQYAQGLILDVGSGHRPFQEAHILCDLYPKDNSQRCDPLRRNAKPFVNCDAQYLPFKNKAFNFVHCSHVLEHSYEPAKIVRELKRVAKSGYIEAPTWFSENVLYGWKFHKWVIMEKNDKLYYQKPKRLYFTSHWLLPVGFIFHRISSRFLMWQAIHYALDTCLNLFTLKYYF